MMAKCWYFILLILFSIPVARTQQTSSIFDLLSNVASSTTNANCPGECRHVLVLALFCNNVDESIDCKNPQMKCCISSEETDDLKSTSINSTIKPLLLNNITSTISPKTCPGVCVKADIAPFCKQVINDISCIDGNKCCITENNITTQFPPQSKTIATTTPNPRSKTTEHQSTCKGSCVGGFWSLLCDDIDESGTCPGSERCCVEKKTVSTTPAGPVKCPGYCMPTILSGMCNKPARLKPDAIDCIDGAICCDNSEAGSGVPTSATPADFSLFPFLLNAAQTALQSSQGSDQLVLSEQTNVADRLGPQSPFVKDNAEMSLLTKKFSCGIKNVNRVDIPRGSGRQQSAPGEWCWQVALVNARNQYVCGGALIGTQWVVTAANCIKKLQNGEKLYAKIGVYDLGNEMDSAGAQTLNISSIYIHHSHNSYTLNNNIALLKLATNAELRESVCFVCLPAKGMDFTPGKQCTVTGYESTGKGDCIDNQIPSRINDIKLPIIADLECMKQINQVTRHIFILPTDSFCASGEIERDTCQRDEGGPMVCEVEGFYELTGIASPGFGCGYTNIPGVYVKISSYIGWINQIISTNSHERKDM